MTGVGGELRKEREARNILLQDIARSTKIGLRYLEALEEDRLDRIPGVFFVKGIIRTYAQAVGLDEHAVLEKFRDAGFFQEPGDTEDEEKMRFTHPGRQRLVVSIAAAVILVAASVYLYISARSGKDAAGAEISAFASPPPVSDPSPTDLSPLIAEEPAEDPGLVFEAVFNQETWIQVFADGLIEVNGIRQPGAMTRVRAEKELLIHLGNAGGFNFTLNGRPGRSFGRSGVVVRNILITPENMGEFLAEPEKNGKPSLRP